MLGKHRTAVSHACDTEALEDALEAACGGNLQITHRLELRRLAISLWYDAETKKQGTTHQHHAEPLTLKPWQTSKPISSAARGLQIH